MRLYAEYIKEIMDMELIKGDDYFYTYKVEDSHIYLQDVYIRKEKRESGLMDSILKEVVEMAKEKNKEFVTSSICKNASEEVFSRTNYILTKNLFEEYTKDDNMIYYCKEII